MSRGALVPFAVSTLLLGASSSARAQPAPAAPPSSAQPAPTAPPSSAQPAPTAPPSATAPPTAASEPPPAASTAPPAGSAPPQPPPSGYPPQAYPQGYPPPGYAPYPYPYPYRYPYPYPYPQPPRPVVKRRPAVMPYNPNALIPDGYHLETRKNGRLIGAGAGVLGGSWFFSVVLASVIIEQNDGDDLGYGPLYAPILGPFIALGTAKLDWDQDGYVGALLVLDGLAQAGGAAMLLTGLLMNVKVLVRDPDTPAVETKTAGAYLVPDVRIGPGSASVAWRF